MKTYRGVKRVAKRHFERHAEMIEKDVIIQFLRDLPIDELKKLIGFECFDPENMKKPEVEFNSMDELDNYLELRAELYFKSEVEFRCEILIP